MERDSGRTKGRRWRLGCLLIGIGGLLGAGLWAFFRGPSYAKQRFGELLAGQVKIEPGALAAEQEDAQKEGIPLTPNELYEKPIADDPSNAGPLYSELLGSVRRLRITRFAARESAFAYLRSVGPVPPFLRSQMDQDGPLLGRIVEASWRPKCVFDRKWEDGMATIFPEYPGLKSACIVLACRAVVKARDGLLVESIDDLAACVRLANHAGQEPGLIQAFVEIALAQITLRAIVQAATLRADEIAYLNNLRNVASRLVIPDMRRAILGELVMSVTTIRAIPRIIKEETFGPDSVSDAERGFAGQPHVREAGELRTIQFFRKLLALIEKHSSNPRTLAQELDAMEEAGEGPDLVLSAVQGLGSGGSPFPSQAALSFAKMRTEIRLATLAIDILLFRKRTGSWPSRLEDVGKVPIDAVSGASIRFVPNKQGFAVYGFGPNFRDDKMAKDSGSLDLDQVVRVQSGPRT